MKLTKYYFLPSLTPQKHCLLTWQHNSGHGSQKSLKKTSINQRSTLNDFNDQSDLVVTINFTIISYVVRLSKITFTNILHVNRRSLRHNVTMTCHSSIWIALSSWTSLVSKCIYWVSGLLILIARCWFWCLYRWLKWVRSCEHMMNTGQMYYENYIRNQHIVCDLQVIWEQNL